MATDRAPSGSEIAVIGMAGRFPGARSIDEYWSNLLAGRESITTFTLDELRAAGVPEEDLQNPDYVRASPTLADVDLFDAEFFRISPREAKFLDPQHRLFLECAWEVLEQAGYDPSRSKHRVGVFAGASISTYLLYNLARHGDGRGADRAAIMFGNAGDFMPTRASYKLNLTGPSVNVQTACSTSLAAVHLACQNLLAGEADVIIAGGVTVQVPQAAGYVHHRESILSPDGHCRVFDADARGTLFGSGIGVVLLKRLEDAIADRDPIAAVILGGAMNNDGAGKMGYSAPSASGQRDVIAEALSIAAVAPETIGYIEAHGTGTLLGDPIEVSALAEAFADDPRRGTCAIGSVKSNIGHLDIAAGIAGFIKAVLSVQHGKIPPTLHVAKPNPALGLEATPFFVNTTLREWPADPASPRRAGVSSFGIGGTNVHVVLEEAPVSEVVPRPGPELLLLSARTKPALAAAAGALADHLAAADDVVLADVAYTLRVGRQAFGERCYAVAADVADGVAALRSPDLARLRTRTAAAAPPRLVFMFPGQGSQYRGMARGLYEREPEVRADIERCCELFERAGRRRLLPLLVPPADQASSASDALDDPELVQLALFTIEYALARQLQRWGIRPAAVIGHSIGEYAAACVAGVFTLEDAVKAVSLRSRLMAETAPGAMLVVSSDERSVREIVGTQLDLAAINAPSQVVLSGLDEAISAAEATLERRGIRCRRLRVRRANHSSTMDPIVDVFRRELSSVKMSAPTIPWFSTVTGAWVDAKTATDPSYWATQLRRSVLFGEAVRFLHAEAATLFVEVGPGKSLTSLARIQTASAVAMLPARDGVEEAHAPLGGIGELWLAGVELDSAAFDDGHRRRTVLPTYRFQRKRHWVDPPRQQEHRTPGTDDSSDGSEPNAGEGEASPDVDAGLTTEIEKGLAAIWRTTLGVAVVGLDDDFYALGGDSLIGTQVIARIREQLKVDARLADVFDAPTLRELSARLERRAKLDEVPLRARPASANAELPLTLEQFFFWHISRLELETGAGFQLPVALRISGPLQIEALERAISEIVRRHESLRTRFVETADGEPRQIVMPPYAVTLPLHRAESLDEAIRVANEEGTRPVDFDSGRLLRCVLVATSDTEYVLVVSVHHIVSDGWSIGVFFRELGAFYEDFRAGRKPSGKVPTVQFGDYALWQREWVASEGSRKELEYWKKQLAHAPALTLPTDRPRPPRQIYDAGIHFWSLPRELATAVKTVAKSHRVSTFVVLVSTLGAFLAERSRQTDLVIGTIVANRAYADLEDLIGCFSTPLALRLDLSGAPTPETLFERTARTVFDAFANQKTPYELVEAAVDAPPDPSRLANFQVSFIYQNAPLPKLELGGLTFQPIYVELTSPQLPTNEQSEDRWAQLEDMVIDAGDMDGEMWFRIEYNANLWDASTIASMSEGWQAVMKKMAGL